jgi:hypothetical protein
VNFLAPAAFNKVEVLHDHMKKTIVAAILALTATTGLFAQGRPERGGTPPTAEQMIDRRVQMLTTLLTLDSAQQAQAKTIFTDEATASKALQTGAQAAHEALQAAVKAGASDAQIDQLAAAVGTVQGQGAAIHAKAQTKFRLILNSAQKEKLDAAQSSHGPGGPGMGGRGGFGGGGPRF